MNRRKRHPNKEIEGSVQYAESKGWTCVLASGHAWGRIRCPHKQRGGCQMPIWSTPRNPQKFANLVKRRVDKCPH